jgi:oxygen-independent coproporphyrinogen-3 oxidase
MRGIVFTSEDRLRGQIIERLMCDFAVDLGAVAASGGDFAAERATLAPLLAEELVRVDGERIIVTAKGRPFVRLVAAAFDAHLLKAQARHSVVV